MQVLIPKRKNAPQTKLYVEFLQESIDGGGNRDVIILIPGGPGGNHTLYDDLKEELFKHFDLLLIDLRGCGYSEPSEVEFCTLDNHIEDIEIVRKALDLSCPIVHGCSYGAMVAIGYAIRFSENISKLILSSATASGDFIESAKNNLAERGSEEQIDIAKLLWFGNFESPEQFSKYYRIMAPLYSCRNVQDKILSTPKQNIPYNIALVNYAFTNFLLDFNFVEHLNAITCPTLIFSGRQDWITDVYQAEIVHDGISGSELVILDSCGHFPWKDQREQFLEYFYSFLEDEKNLTSFPISQFSFK